MSNPFQIVIDGNFETLGRDAVFAPEGGDEQDIKVMPRRADQFIDLGDSTIQTQGSLFDVRVSEVPSPAEGDRLVYDGSTYYIQNLSHPDGDRLLWLFDCYEE